MPNRGIYKWIKIIRNLINQQEYTNLIRMRWERNIHMFLIEVVQSCDIFVTKGHWKTCFFIVIIGDVQPYSSMHCTSKDIPLLVSDIKEK